MNVGFLTWNICRGKYANQSTSITFMDHFTALLEYSKQYGHCNVPKKDWYQCIIPITEYNPGVEKQYNAPLGSWLYVNKLKYLKLKMSPIATTLMKNTSASTTNASRNITTITTTNNNIDYNLPTVMPSRSASSRNPSIDLEQKLEQMEHSLSSSQCQSLEYDHHNNEETITTASPDTNNNNMDNTNEMITMDIVIPENTTHNDILLNNNNNNDDTANENTLELDGAAINAMLNNRGNTKGTGVSDKIRLILFQQLINQGTRYIFMNSIVNL